jgi:uncharacterized damage-inducible protein DinB
MPGLLALMKGEPVMTSGDAKPRKHVEPLAGYAPDIGRWLWALEYTRRATKTRLAGITPHELDWIPFGEGNSIGTLLYHIAAIELDWLYTEVLEGREPWSQEITDLFRVEVRDEQGRLSLIRGVRLSDHIHRLDVVRECLLAAFRDMTVREFRRLHSFPAYDVTPEWVLHHLIQHEADHCGQIELLRSLAAQTVHSP